MSNPSNMNIPDFSLKSYISRYDGNTKLVRLQFIAETSSIYREEACRLLASFLFSPENMNTHLCVKLNQLFKDLNIQYNPNLVDEIELKARQRQDQLDVELQSSKNKMIKESIRLAYNDLGDFFSRRGLLSEAFKTYLRARDYCSTSNQTAELGFNIVRIAIDDKDYRNAKMHITKLEQLCKDDSYLSNRFKLLRAIIMIHDSDYLSAAMDLISIESTTSYVNITDTMAPEDITLYAVICSIASLDRANIKRNLLENPQFKNCLDLTPWCMILLNYYINGEYALLFSFLNDLKPQLMLDIHLSGEINKLFSSIKEKSISQYLAPYSTVNLNKMSEIMQLDASSLEDLIAVMITDKKLSYVIDSESKILYRQNNNLRKESFSKILNSSRSHVRDLKTILLKISLLKHNFSVEIDSESHRMKEYNKVITNMTSDANMEMVDNNDDFEAADEQEDF